MEEEREVGKDGESENYGVHEILIVPLSFRKNERDTRDCLMVRSFIIQIQDMEKRRGKTGILHKTPK